jgi:hypothetical protein
MCNPRLAKLSVSFAQLENFGSMLLLGGLRTWSFVKIVQVLGIKRRQDNHRVMLARLVSTRF